MSSSDGWKYSEYSQPSLKRFLDVINQLDENEDDVREGREMWSKMFPEFAENAPTEIECVNQKPEETKSNKNIDDCDIIEILDDHMEIEENKLTNEKPMELPDNKHVVDELVEQIMDDLQNDMFDDECFENLLKNENLPLFCAKLAELLSHDDLFHKVCIQFCNVSDKPSDFIIKTILESFILPYIKKNNSSRIIIKSLSTCVSKYPLEMIEIVICPLMHSVQPVSLLINPTIITDLELKYRNTVLRKVFESYSHKVEEWVLPVILIIVKSIPNHAFTDYELLVKFLYSESKRFNKSIAYGKLLYATMQEFSIKDNVTQELIESIIAENQSPFKQPCLNILNK